MSAGLAAGTAGTAGAADAERQRLAALAEHGLEAGSAVLGDEPDVRAALRLAVTLTGAAQASLNVIGEHEQHCLVQQRGARGDAVGGRSGPGEGPLPLSVPREESLCEWGRRLGGLERSAVDPSAVDPSTVDACVTDDEVVHTPDARADPRWAGHPWVDGRSGAVRGFASAPLHDAQGNLLGTLCVLDDSPLELGAHDLASLRDLARMTSGLLGRRRETLAAARSAALAEQRRALLDLLYAESASRSEMMDAVLDTIDVAVVACDASGSLTLFNRAAREWHGGYPDPDVSAAEHSERYGLYHGDGVTPLAFSEVPLHRALLGEDVAGVEVVLAPVGLPRRTALVSAQALTAVDGTVMGAVAAMADVSADRQRRAELQRSNTDLEHFAASASHDLAAPLAVVGGYLELVADEYAPVLGQRGAGWVETSRAGVARMQSLIEALLAYARAGGAELAASPTSVAAAAAEALADLGVSLAAARASVVMEDLPQVMADPVLLRQLVQNLVSNAVSHRRERGDCRIRLSAERAGTWWVVSVADNGPGIPPSLRESVFDVFSTGSAAGVGLGGVRAGGRAGEAAGERTGRRANGHGIGLATCRRTVERHGGRIWVEATSGGGATVRFTLPAA